MIISTKNRKNIILFLICFILKISFSLQKYLAFRVNATITDNEFKIMHINNDLYNEDEHNCQYYVPSLLIPIVLLPSIISTKDFISLDRKCIVNFPIFKYEFSIGLYKIPFLDFGNVIAGKERFGDELTDCLLGLSIGKPNFDINENEILLNHLYNYSYIERKIFSFDKWNINNKDISSNLYLGDIHENFISNNGIIGKCKNYDNEPFWGCTFKEMIFNNSVVSLTNDNGIYYKIYFSTETYNIIFPNSFKNKFKIITNNLCSESDNIIICHNVFDNENYFPLKLSNDKMAITTEIDNINRFSNKNSEDKDKTRIKFEDIDYFILPLIMFKRFHVQFDGNNNIISFYTTDSSILQIKGEKEEPINNGNDDNNNNNNISTVLLICIIIIVVLVVIIIGLVIYICIRRKNIESNIKKDIKKIEDIEEFHSLE